METLRYNIKLVDPELTIKVEDELIEYDRRLTIKKSIVVDDYIVTIDMSEVSSVDVTLKALFIHSSGVVTVIFESGTEVVINGDYFVTGGDPVDGIQTTSDTSIEVSIYGYGVVN